MIISIVNQKGGVGKTTTAINLSYNLVELGKKVLLIDFDPQSAIARSLGIKFDDSKTILELLKIKHIERFRITDIHQVIVKKHGIDIIPSCQSLSSVDTLSSNEIAREMILKKSLDELDGIKDYDFVIIDCSPQPGFINSLPMITADHCIITMQADILSINALESNLETIRSILENYPNLDINVCGILITMLNNNLNLSKHALKEIDDIFPNVLFESMIRRNVSIAEAPAYHMPVCLYRPSSSGSNDYKSFSREFLERINVR